MIDDKQLFEDWYRHASGAEGFIGGALKAQRAKAFLTQEQQRAMIGLLGESYDHLWLRLQAMSLPRAEKEALDLSRIAESLVSELEIAADIDIAQLAELIHAGLDPSAGDLS